MAEDRIIPEKNTLAWQALTGIKKANIERLTIND
jgi:hypothetical protein